MGSAATAALTCLRFVRISSATVTCGDRTKPKPQPMCPGTGSYFRLRATMRYALLIHRRPPPGVSLRSTCRPLGLRYSPVLQACVPPVAAVGAEPASVAAPQLPRPPASPPALSSAASVAASFWGDLAPKSAARRSVNTTQQPLCTQRLPLRPVRCRHLPPGTCCLSRSASRSPSVAPLPAAAPPLPRGPHQHLLPLTYSVPPSASLHSGAGALALRWTHISSAFFCWVTDITAKRG